jgi:predicted lipoprotein with Yx(FWY)xxD motif
MMNKIVAALAATALCVSMLALTALPASAQPVYSGRILCVAQSTTGYGYGSNMNRDVACQIALQQCAVRTPPGYHCYVTRVTWERLY